MRDHVVVHITYFLKLLIHHHSYVSIATVYILYSLKIGTILSQIFIEKCACSRRERETHKESCLFSVCEHVKKYHNTATLCVRESMANELTRQKGLFTNSSSLEVEKI